MGEGRNERGSYGWKICYTCICESQPQEWSVTSNFSLLWLYIICRKVISMPFPLLLWTTRSLLTSHFSPDKSELESVGALFSFVCLIPVHKAFHWVKLVRLDWMFALANGKIIYSLNEFQTCISQKMREFKWFYGHFFPLKNVLR